MLLVVNGTLHRHALVRQAEAELRNLAGPEAG
jgi:hypothetical protein